jgi:phenylacetate-CoA ligase
MIKKAIFILAHSIGHKDFYPVYQKLMKDQWKHYEELKREQERQLKVIINYSYDYVPFYNRLFDSLNLKPEDINKIEDLEKLPILTKSDIKSHWEDFKPSILNKIKYYNFSTGGSTGTPFKYRITKFERFLDSASRYKGWSFGGYELGDRVVFLGGSSIGIGNITTLPANLNKQIHEYVRNIKMLSSFDMGEDEINKYIKIINSFKPYYLYGYASSIYLLSKWIEENNVAIYQPKGVLTTAEKLYPHMRTQIEKAFSCKVYDTYGLGDGGVHASECAEHCGLHIATERSIMEVVDKDGNQLEYGEGRILATSLYNYAMPFIRYDTGDLGTISNDICACGRGYKLLRDVIGRSADFLITPEGKNVHGWFFNPILWEYTKNIKEYQIVQEKLEKIVIKIVPEGNFDITQFDMIREAIRKKSTGWIVEFKLVDSIDRTRAGKYKFIINELNKNAK